MHRSKRPLVFLAVGVINTLLDFGFYTFLTLTFFRDGPIALAGILSGTFALVCALITHSLITWRGHHTSVKTIVRFFAFTGTGMWLLRPLLLSFFIHFSWLYTYAHTASTTLGLPFDYTFIANTGAFGFMVILLLIYNYLTYDRFVFNQTPRTHTEPKSRSES